MSAPPTACALVAIFSMWCAQAANAQTPAAKKWEVEFHAGGLIGNHPTSGTAIPDFPRGAAISTGGNTMTTRSVSSWYFGDGAVLLNEVNAVFRVTPRITALDSTLRRALAQPHGAGTLGFRVARHLTSRFSGEFTLDYSRRRLELTDEAVAAIEESRATFINAWSALLGTGATTNRIVTSVTDLERGSGSQVIASGALNIELAPARRLSPFVTVGAGSTFNRGAAPRATLTGNYRFLFGAMFPMNETDTVTVRVDRAERITFGILGGGFKYGITSRQGLRIDARIHLAPNDVSTTVNATPSVMLQSPPFAISTGTNPSVQFSNTQTLGRQSSLSGPAIADLRTFEGNGLERRISVTVGYFVRF